MINKNDFKYIIKKIIIGLAIAFILFNINKCNASALVYKDSFYSSYTITGQTNSTFSNGSREIVWNFNNYDFSNNYDYVAFKFGTFNFSHSFDSGNYCMEWAPGSTATCSSNGCYSCHKYFNYDGIETTNISNLYINPTLHYYYNDADYYVPCTFNAGQDYMFYCPLRKDYDPVDFRLDIKSKDYISYNVGLNGFKYYYNNESTDIVNGLTGMQQHQQQTNSIISDNNISGANTATNNALSGINNSVNNTLDSSINANTLNTLLTGFVNQLSNSTCTPITLPIPFTTENIVLPCLGTEFSQRIPVIWSLYELIITGVIVLRFWQHAVEFILNVLDPYHIGANNIPTGGGK